MPTRTARTALAGTVRDAKPQGVPTTTRQLLGIFLLSVIQLAACARPGVEVVVPRPGEGEGEGEGETGEGEGETGEGEGETGEGEGETGEGEGEGEDGGLVDVDHPRELRGAWIATVFGINWPGNANSSAAVKEAELVDLVNTVADAGVNAIFFQARPESDAMYASTLEPWSRFLTGTQGRDPGFDPLQVAIDTAHARGVELHAWINPYRGLTSSGTTAASNHVTRRLAGDAVAYNGGVWMNPASTAVRAHVVDVVSEIVANYDVDGIHFDDYFYPYPSDVAFDDDDQFSAYTSSGGTLSRSAWRRENVNALIEDVSTTLTSLRPSARFGVSPFGIYRPGTPAGITGLDAYEAISCDPVTWLAMDWVDYLAPQLYWETTQTRQAFGTLLPWWASLTDGDGRFVAAGMNLAAEFGLDEYTAQIDVVRAHADSGAKGSVLYHVGPIVDDEATAALFASLNARPALLPPVVADPTVPEPPFAFIDGADVVVEVPNDARGVALYVDGETPTLQLLRFGNGPLRVPHGGVNVVVTIVGKNDRESRGVRLQQ